MTGQGWPRSRLREGQFAEKLLNPAQIAEPRFRLTADPAADSLDRHTELARRGFLGEPLPAQRAGHPVGERVRPPGRCCPARGGAAAGHPVPGSLATCWLECRTSISTCSGKIRNETWIAPSGPAASSRARKTVSPTSRVPLSVRRDSARQRLTRPRISGIHEGRAGKVWDSTTTGTTSIGESPCPSARSGTGVSLVVPPAIGRPAQPPGMKRLV